MSASSRREKIEDMLRDDPQDQFLRYGLAIEYDNEERFKESLTLFQGLANETPPHVPSFFRASQLLVRLDRLAEARTLLRNGIEAARQQGNAHAAAEMSEYLVSLSELPE